MSVSILMIVLVLVLVLGVCVELVMWLDLVVLVSVIH